MTKKIYKLTVHKRVAKDLSYIPKRDVEAILQAIEALKSNPRPHGYKQLSARSECRFRVGVYRILYSIDDVAATVQIEQVSHRKDAYR
jgi:mRNA interferase RelE/StbE